MTLRIVGDEDSAALRTPPHNYEAERALLGAIFMNNSAYDRVATFLRSEHFADPLNGRLYETCQKLIENNIQANPVTLKSFCENDDLLRGAGGMKYLAALAAGAVTMINSTEYGRLIFDLFLRRELIGVGENLVNKAFDVSPDEAAFDLASEVSERVSMLVVGEDGYSTSIGDAADKEIKRWERADAGEAMGLSSGIPALDQAAGLLHDRNLIVLAGRPSMGKSTLAIQIALNTARIFKATADITKAKPLHVMFFSLEMSEEELTSKFLSMMTGLSMPENRTTILLPHEWGRIAEAQAELKTLPIIFDCKSDATPGYIRAQCRRRSRIGGVGLIIADHLQHMAADQETDNRTQEVSHLTRRCKAIAKDVGCPFILLSQLNRQLEQREDKRPQLSDLRESGAIEQDSDVVMFVFREAYYLERSMPKRREGEVEEKFSQRLGDHCDRLEAARDKAEISIAKRRMGPAGKTAFLEFNAETGTFKDAQAQAAKPLVNNNTIGGGWDNLPDIFPPFIPPGGTA